MKAGDLVKFTFAKTSSSINPDNIYCVGILLKEEILPLGSWAVMIDNGNVVHADVTEIEVINAH